MRDVFRVPLRFVDAVGEAFTAVFACGFVESALEARSLVELRFVNVGRIHKVARVRVVFDIQTDFPTRATPHDDPSPAIAR